jgi:hypothetical protein
MMVSLALAGGKERSRFSTVLKTRPSVSLLRVPTALTRSEPCSGKERNMGSASEATLSSENGPVWSQRGAMALRSRFSAPMGISLL